MKEIKIDVKMQKDIEEKINAYMKKTRLRNTLLRILTFIASAVAMYTFIQMAKQVTISQTKEKYLLRWQICR